MMDFNIRHSNNIGKALILLIGIYFIFFENIEKVLLKLPNIKDEPAPKIKNLKLEIYKWVNSNTGIVSNTLNTVYFAVTLKFGNALIDLNKAIFYGSFLGIKRIIVGKNMWFIKKRLIVNGIIIEPYKKIKCNNPKEILCLTRGLFYYFYPSVPPQSYYSFLQNEIYNNLNNTKSDSNNLYIHIRSGDIFKRKHHYRQYYQPPLCFYTKIINENKFKKIFLLTNGFENPNVKKLLELYPNIIYQNNELIHDINLLAHAENIVVSTSSFVWTIINFSKYVKNIWYYDLFGKEHKLVWLITEENRKDKIYTEYVMKPKEDYTSKMIPFTTREGQLKLMVEYKCEGEEFVKIGPKS